MIDGKLLRKKYVIYSIFVLVIFVSNHSKAVYFPPFIPHASDIRDGVVCTAQDVWNGTRYILGFGPVMDRLDTISGKFNNQLGRVSSNVTGQLETIGRQLVEQTQQAGTGLVTSVNQHLDTTVQQFTNRVETISNNLVSDVNERLDTTTQNIINNVDIRAQRLLSDMDTRVDQALKKGMLLAGGVALTSIAGWYGAKFLYNVLDRYYRQPKLFQETSQKTLLQKLRELIHKPQSEPQVLIFDRRKEAELASLTQSVKNTNAKLMAGDPTVRHRSVLLWGPPGTGKTAFASKLARESGMDFKTMSGADVSKLTIQDALNALDEVMEYAQRSKKGLILMVDEAESLFAERVGVKPDSASYLVLSKFLSLTSGRIKKLMLIVTTNHKEVFDEAFVSRLDKSIEIKLPDYNERLAILRLYKDKYLTDGRYNSAEFISSVTEHLNDYKMEQLANQLTGCSGRDLESVMHNIKAESGQILTAEVVNKVVQDILDKAIQFHQNSGNARNLPNHLPSDENSFINAAARLSLSCQAG